MAASSVRTEPTEAQALMAHFDGIDGLLATYEPARYSAKTLTAARVAQGNLHVRTGHGSAAEFIASATGDSLGDTKNLIQLGENLADQPDLAESFLGGRLSHRRAALVSDAAKVNPTREADLVKGAETDTDAGVKEQCLRAKAEGRTGEAAERHRRRLHESRSARTWTDTDGAFHLDARFAPEAGAELKAALEAQTDRQFHRARREGRFENADAYRADALLALVTGTGLLGVGNTEPPRRAGAGDPAPDTPVRTREPKATVNVVVDLDTLRRGNVQPGERCEIPGVGPVSVTHARELLGDSLFNVVVTSATDIHSIWSPGRHLRRDVRAGLLLRDPRCVVPAWVSSATTGSPTSPRVGSPASTTWPGSASATTASGPTRASSSARGPTAGSGSPRPPGRPPSGPGERSRGPRPRPGQP